MLHVSKYLASAKIQRLFCTELSVNSQFCDVFLASRKPQIKISGHVPLTPRASTPGQWTPDRGRCPCPPLGARVPRPKRRGPARDWLFSLAKSAPPRKAGQAPGMLTVVSVQRLTVIQFRFQERLTVMISIITQSKLTRSNYSIMIFLFNCSEIDLKFKCVTQLAQGGPDIFEI